MTTLFRPAAAAVLVGLLLMPGRQAFPQADAARNDAALPLLTLRVRAIPLADDDGGRAADIHPDEVRAWVEHANRAYAAAGVRFLFDPSRDFTHVRSTLLNRMMPGDPRFDEITRRGNEIAANYSEEMVVFFRFGDGDGPTGNGFSSTDYNFVTLPGFKHTSILGEQKIQRQNIGLFAHEVGHYLGLAHTFRREFPTVAEAKAFFLKNGARPEMFDGDGLSDTPPTPHIRELDGADARSVRLGNTTFPIPRDNLMSYYHWPDPRRDHRTLTPQQIAGVRRIVELRRRGKGGLPVHTGLRAPLEAESLPVAAQSDCDASVQDMNSFGAGRWSGGRQLFCSGSPAGSVTVLLPVRAAGVYRIDLYATYAPDFAQVQAYLGENFAGNVFDAWAPVVCPSGPIPLGSPVRLAAGTHRLRFEIFNKQDASSGYRFGIDCVELVRVPPASATPTTKREIRQR